MPRKVVILLALLTLITACGRGYTRRELVDTETQPTEIIEQLPPAPTPEPQPTEDERTHIEYRVNRWLSLEMPADWYVYDREFGRVVIHPFNINPHRRAQTRLEIRWELADEPSDIWSDDMPMTNLGGVPAYGGEIGNGDIFMTDPESKGQNFFIFHEGRFYDIRFMSEFGERYNHWSSLEGIRDSVRFGSGE